MWRPYVALALAMASWGLSITIADLALESLSSADLLLAEIGLGTAIIGLILGWRSRRRTNPRPSSSLPPASWRAACLLGLLEPGATYLLGNLGLSRTTAAAGSMLTSLESVWAVLLAWWILHERPRRIEALALGLGVSGAIVVSLGDSGGRATLSGNLLMVLASLTAALYFLVSRQRAGHVDLLSLVAKQGVWSLAIAVPYALWSWNAIGSQLPQADLRTWLLALAAGITGFAIPFMLWSWAVSRVRPTLAAVGLNLIPVFGVLSALALGRGAPTWAQVAGGLILLAGLGLLTRSEMSRDPQPTPAAVAEPRV